MNRRSVPPGYIEAERSLESIVIGTRHRKDAGDIDALADSIDRLGLLQPITVTPEGVLVCGWRRLMAIRALGHRVTNVWVRSGVSDRLASVLAQQDENTMHKPLSQLEAAHLYRELKQLMAEDAAHRQAASRFGSDPDDAAAAGGMGTGADSAPPADGGPVRPGADSAPPQSLVSRDARKTRRQAAVLVTGKASYSRLEQINALQTIAADPDQPSGIREMVRRELASIDNGAAVDPAFARVRAALAAVAEDGTANHETSALAADDLQRRAAEAIARAKQRAQGGGSRSRGTSHGSGSRQIVGKPSVRSFAMTWADLDGWINQYDPAEIGVALTSDQWACFCRVLDEATAFARAATTARAQADPQPA